MNKKNNYTGLELAVIGMSCRFPEANNTDEFWKNIENGNECIRFYNKKEILDSGVDINLASHPDYVNTNGGEIEDRFGFDAGFFNYTLDEALLMDPHVRLMHECVYNALEDSGYLPEIFAGRVGLFAGSSPNMPWEVLGSLSDSSTRMGPWSAAHYLNKDFGSNLISFKLGLKGPSLNVSTACSTSLVTIHMAARSILLGECEIAVAGGVSLNLNEQKGYLFQKGMVATPDGHCRAFDAHAQGTVPGEGVGMVVLKKLSKAIEDQDIIHAVIKGSSINNDGSGKSGFTAPGVEGQTQVIKSALKFAKVSADTIGYVETHGTGTKLGDPIEIKSLTKGFGTKKKNYCYLGAVKANIGHLDAAAGVAGFIKTVLVLKNKVIPPLVHFNTPNPFLKIEDTPFLLSAKKQRWKSDSTRRAAVSSFGIGGTNAHVILEEYNQEISESNAVEKYKVFVISAATPESMIQIKQNLKNHIMNHPDIRLQDICYTLQSKRTHFKYREGTIVENREQLLAAFEENRFVKESGLSDEAKIFLLFPGQGTQYTNMGKTLFETEEIFRSSLIKCFTLLKSYTGKDFKKILFSENNEEQLIRTENCQPLLFSIQYALAQLLKSWNIAFDAFLGHSIGEYTAACLAGVFTLEEALQIVSKRGRFMQDMKRGSMLVVNVGWQELLKIKPDSISFASINTDMHSTLSGSTEDILEFEKILSTKGYNTSILETSHAFHSPMMKEASIKLEAILADMQLNRPGVPFVSNVSGTWITPLEANSPKYWARQLEKPVQLNKGIESLLNEKKAIIIEMGPKNSMAPFLRANKNFEPGHRIISLLSHKKDVEKCENAKLKLLELWANGLNIVWEKSPLANSGKKTILPQYPFLHKEFKLNRAPLEELLKGHAIPGREIKESISEWFYSPSWKKLNISSNHKQVLWSRTLIIGSDHELMSKMRQTLENFSDIIYELHIGTERSVDHKKNRFAIDGSDLSQYLEFFDFFNTSKEPLTIIDTSFSSSILDENTINRASFYHLLNIAKSLKKLIKPSSLLFYAITVENHQIIGTENHSLNYSFLSASLRIIGQEVFHVDTRHIDIDLKTLEEKELFEQAIPLALSKDIKYDTLGIRNGNHCWVPHFEKKEVNNIKERKSFETTPIYVIIGGLGLIGSILGTSLAKKGAKLVLIGKSAFDTISEVKLNRWNEIKNLCDTIHYEQVDVADLDGFKMAFDKIEQTFGRINGVFYLAASEMQSGQDDLIENITAENCENQLDPKINGVVNLSEVLASRSPEFVMLFSSLASILGGIGYYAYAAANAFMDCFASFQNRTSTTEWVSLNWDGWVAANHNMQQTLSITVEDGKLLFEDILEWTLYDQLIISTHDLQGRLSKWVYKTSERKSTTISDNESLFLKRPDLSTSLKAPETELEKQLLPIWKEMFGFEEIGVLDDFYELGGDSLKALQLINDIRSKLEKDISLIDFYKEPTIRGIVGLIDNSEFQFERIEKVEEKERYLLSSAQKRLFFLQEFDKNSTAYNSPKALRITGNLNIERLKNAFEILLKRHESLRTSIILENEIPYQIVNENVDFEVEYSKASFSNELLSKFIRPFDLKKAPFLRVGILEENEDSYVLMIDIHHIVTDGISHGILLKEFMTAYREETLLELRLQYKDYAEWQNSIEQKKELQKQEIFWLKKFDTLPEVLQLPSDFIRPKIADYRGSKLNYKLSLERSKKLEKLAKEEKSTLFTLLLGVFNVLLCKLGNTEDVVVGVPVAGRNHSDLDNIIGMFVNTLALRNTVPAGESFSSFLRRLSRTSLEAFDNQIYPYEDLVNKLEVERVLNRNPLFDVSFSFENFENVEFKLPEVDIESVDIEHNISKFDLTLTIVEHEQNLYFGFEYKTCLFAKDTIERFWSYTKKIIDDIIEDRNRTLASISILSSEELTQQLTDFNQTSVSYPSGETLVSLFRSQVLACEDATALVYESREMSYGELDRLSNQLAHYLISQGVMKETLVGIMLERSEWLLVSILAVLKSGGAYVPIDPAYPSDRIEYMLTDSNCTVRITEDLLNDFQAEKSSYSSGLPDSTPESDQLAYVIYTSGSTGKPKGVAITHSNSSALIHWSQQEFRDSSYNIVYAMTSHCFDLSIFEMFYPLSVGKPIRMLSSAMDLGSYLELDKGILLNTVPSVVRSLLDSGVSMKSISVLNMAGEALTSDLVNALDLSSIEVRNLYGPSEDTTYSTSYLITAGVYDRIPIGGPISNTYAYVLDKDLQLLPLGCVGLLYLSGAGLSRGYLNRTDLTSARFIPNPFDPGSLMYNTGDLVRWDREGNLEYVGREDTQVKVRGYRIELGEIEHHLSQHESVRVCRVLFRRDGSGAGELVAYCVSAGEVSTSEYQQYLSDLVPGYMVPGIFIHLESMPLTSNGKTDTAALKAIVLDSAKKSNNYVAPETETEKRMLLLWQEVLDRDMIGVTDNFFTIGGHSLKAIQLILKIQKEFKIRIEVREIFTEPTIKSLADFLDSMQILNDEKFESYDTDEELIF
jgi:iturin family lipopeptide synthetase A